MKRYATGICIFLTSLIVLITMSVLTCSAKMTAYLIEKQESIVVARGVEGLDDAKRAVEKDLADKVSEASVEAFESLTANIYNSGVNITEEEANSLYKKTVYQMLKEKYGMTNCSDDEAVDNLKINLRELLPKLKTGELQIADMSTPELILDADKVRLNNISVDFSYGNTYSRDIEFDCFANLSDIILYDENPELFNYSLVADKGIYITGKTSTIIGNIYTGTHSPSELRKAEALYGESDSYGGLNIMSTQIAIGADRIVTDGAVNMKGAFVVFGSEDSPVEIIAKEIKETDNIANKNIYGLFGSVSSQDISLEKNMVKESMQYFGSIEHYYDSDNDKLYLGKYRKIFSSTDITVSNDVTGIIMTPGSVIIEEGVNVEGLILCGDRIYIQGNNNIVSSVEVLREILREELYQDVYTESQAVTLEEQALTKLHLNMKDYLGGIKYRGIVR